MTDTFKLRLRKLKKRIDLSIEIAISLAPASLPGSTMRYESEQWMVDEAGYLIKAIGTDIIERAVTCPRLDMNTLNGILFDGSRFSAVEIMNAETGYTSYYEGDTFAHLEEMEALTDPAARCVFALTKIAEVSPSKVLFVSEDDDPIYSQRLTTVGDETGCHVATFGEFIMALGEVVDDAVDHGDDGFTGGLKIERNDFLDEFKLPLGIRSKVLPVEGEESRNLIYESHNIRLQIHEYQKQLTRLQKDESMVVIRLNSIIRKDKNLSNADKRKDALIEFKANDDEYLRIEGQAETIRNEVELLEIKLRFNSDMIKLNLALLSRPVPGELLTALDSLDYELASNACLVAANVDNQPMADALIELSSKFNKIQKIHC